MISADDKIDIIYSSYALHHLNPKDKRNVIKQAISILKVGGYFLNADLITSESLEVEKRIQEIRIDGVVNRAKGNNSRFKDPLMTHRFLDELEKNEGDNPLTLLEDLKILEEAGLKSKTALYFLNNGHITRQSTRI